MFLLRIISLLVRIYVHDLTECWNLSSKIVNNFTFSEMNYRKKRPVFSFLVSASFQFKTYSPTSPRLVSSGHQMIVILTIAFVDEIQVTIQIKPLKQKFCLPLFTSYYSLGFCEFTKKRNLNFVLQNFTLATLMKKYKGFITNPRSRFHV